MKYSIVIANYNYGRYLKEAIESALLVSDDIIVVDDCSTDNSFRIIQEYVGKVRTLYSTVNKGVSFCRNVGIDASKHEYIICLDADDILNPEIKDVTPTTDIVAIGVQHFEGRNDLVLPPENITLEMLLANNQMPVSSPFSKEIWRKVGGFNETIKGYEDWKFWIDCLKLGATISSVRKPLLNYRIHAGGRNVEAVRNHNELKKQII